MPVVGGYEGMMQSQTHDMGQVISAIGGASKLQDMELHGDRARLLRAQAGLAENELTQEQGFAQALSEMGTQPGAEPGKPASRAAPFYRMAEIAERAGAVKKAMEFRKSASTVEHQEQQDTKMKEISAFYKRKEEGENLEKLGGFYASVRSQEDLDLANKRFKETYPQAQLPEWAQTPYSPFLIKGFQDSLLTAQQRRLAVDKDEDQKARETRLEFEREREKRIAAAAKVEAERRAEADKVRAKAGEGKRTTNLGKDFPTLAAREISEAIFDGNIPPEFKREVESAKYVIAATAKQLFDGNRGLDMQQAVAKAVQQSREDNQWEAAEAERPTTTWGVRTGTDKVPGFKFKTRAAESGSKAPAEINWTAPLDVPADRAFNEGKVYKTPRGNLVRVKGGWMTKEQYNAQR